MMAVAVRNWCPGRTPLSAGKCSNGLYSSEGLGRIPTCTLCTACLMSPFPLVSCGLPPRRPPGTPDADTSSRPGRWQLHLEATRSGYRCRRESWHRISRANPDSGSRKTKGGKARASRPAKAKAVSRVRRISKSRSPANPVRAGSTADQPDSRDPARFGGPISFWSGRMNGRAN